MTEIERIAQLEAIIPTLATRADLASFQLAISNDMHELTARMEARFNLIDARFAGINLAVANVDTRFAGIETRIAELRTEIAQSATNTTRWMLGVFIAMFLGFTTLNYTMYTALKPSPPATQTK